MNNYPRNCATGRIAIILFIFIQSTAFECRDQFQCPTNLPKECDCKSEPMFFYSCAKNKEKIWLENHLYLNCTTISDGKIFNLINLIRENSPEFNKSMVELTINSCPLSVLPLIEWTIIGLIDTMDLDLKVNNFTTIPENFFQSQTHLSHLTVTGHHDAAVVDSTGEYFHSSRRN